MVSRPQLALLPTNGLGGRLRATTVRVLATLACVTVALGLAYAAARFTSLFALQEIEVTGGSAAVRESVREAGEQFLGSSLVALDQDEVRQSLTALPAVHSIRLDRAFPHTLRIVVVPERPLALVRNGLETWLVSRQGRVIEASDPDAKRPVVWTLPDTELGPGVVIEDENVRLALDALRQLPSGFPERVASVQVADGGLTLLLADGAEIRLGKAESFALKLAVADRILRSMSGAERAAVGYLDVSVPERAVSGPSLNSQLEG